MMADNTEHQKEEFAGSQGEPPADHVEPARDDTGEAEIVAGEADIDTGEGIGFADPAAFLAAELDRAEAETAKLKDRLVRMVAEMENLRKRTQKDVREAREFSISGFARDMLSVNDNLHRAIDAVPAETRQSDDQGFKALLDGIEMTERGMASTLEKHGVTRLNPLHERFDPNFHQAMFEVPNTEVAHNTVLEVVQDGFVIGTRMLRPAMVGIAKGGPKNTTGSEEAAISADQTTEPDPKETGG